MTDKEKAPVLPEEPLKLGLGLALDLGTETVGAYLYDAPAGRCIAAAGAANAQKMFGEDLMSRILFAETDEKFLRETAVIREQVFDLILKLCGSEYSFADIHYVTIAGNTVMEHLYGAVSPRSIGTPPHTPITLFGEQIIAEPIMYFCPCISGFTGGDITAGLMSSGLAEQEKMSLYLDLGKGFGMALGNREGFLCGSGAKYSEIPGMLAKLLETKGIRVEDIEKVVLAGAFGADEAEVRTALQKIFAAEDTEPFVTEDLLKNAVYCGNAAGYGACLAHTAENREKLKKTAALCTAV